MRRLLSLALLGSALFAGTAAAEEEPTCAYAAYFAVCTLYVCEDICAPEYHVDPQCTQPELNPPSILVSTLCDRVDQMYFVI